MNAWNPAISVFSNTALFPTNTCPSGRWFSRFAYRATNGGKSTTITANSNWGPGARNKVHQ